MDHNNQVCCPCRKCQNAFFQPLGVVEDHFNKPGISFSYQRWIFHGEDYKSGSSSRSNIIGMETNIVRDENINNVEGNDEMYDMLHDAYGLQIHTEESTLRNITSSPNIKEGQIDGLAILLGTNLNIT